DALPISLIQKHGVLLELHRQWLPELGCVFLDPSLFPTIDQHSFLLNLCSVVKNIFSSFWSLGLILHLSKHKKIFVSFLIRKLLYIKEVEQDKFFLHQSTDACNDKKRLKVKSEYVLHQYLRLS